jgi:hypothetical protein
MRALRTLRPLVAVFLSIAAASLPTSASAGEGNCNGEVSSTFELIQKVVFDGHSCTTAACHSGPVRAGGLDLSAGVAFDNLVDRAPTSIPAEQYPGLSRVVPGSKARSLLWLNVAAASLPEEWKAPLRPMPQGGLPPLSAEELDLVRHWIEYGASRDGVVPGTENLFGACLPPPKPIEVEPLPPPPEGLGVQIRAPHQVLPPNRERETCFVSYYDVTDRVPEEFRSEDGTAFRYKRIDARQDPLSHHAVVLVYDGSADIHSPVWGPFACRGGSRDGESCDPTDPNACAGDAICASPPTQAVACIGFGPGDAGIGVADKSLFNTMATAVGGDTGVYDEAPLKGILLWNSHAFNVTDEPAKLDIWLNFDFAAPDEQLHRVRNFVDVSAIFKMHVPAFGADEVCHWNTLPAGARVLSLSSHVHQRGKRFRIFEGQFRCTDGPNAGQACSPLGPDPDYPVPDLCAGSPCEAPMYPPAGDCDSDEKVSIDELLTGVDMALGMKSMDECRRMDADENGAVGIDELVEAVEAAIHPRMRTAEGSLIYTSYTYADPVTLTYDPAKRFGPPEPLPEERTLTYCALYDNGFTDSATVKRNSRVPTNGSPCRPTNCAEGRVGEPCSTNLECDTEPGAGDGSCDACAVGFGITTDDEMFVLAGSYVED